MSADQVTVSVQSVQDIKSDQTSYSSFRGVGGRSVKQQEINVIVIF